MRKKLRVSLFIALPVLTVVALVVFWQPLNHLVDTITGDVRPSCSALPAATVADNKAQELKAFNDDVVRTTHGVGAADFDTQRCPGRVEIHVYYGSEDDKPKLIELWQHSPLKDIPVHWQNM